MRISRLFVKHPLQTGLQIELAEESAHYIRTVLRLKTQQQIVVFNGEGDEYLGLLIEVSKKTVRIAIDTLVSRDVESSLTVTVGMGISRGDRMDWAVQKAVELGINYLTPLETERCVIKFNDDKKQQRWQHWQHIIQHAAEQSGRTRLPHLHAINTMPDWITEQQGLKVFLDPFAEQTFADLSPNTSQITLLSGPEGGFSNHERQIATAAGFIPIRMGARILRTETAILAALAAVQTLWGDFK